MTIESKIFHNPSDYNLAICVLASGSKGNSAFITDGETSILIDAGLSGIELERRLTSRGLSPESLDAIIVTHEHTDHIRGVGIVSRRYKLPVYINQETHKASPSLGDCMTKEGLNAVSRFTSAILPFILFRYLTMPKIRQALPSARTEPPWQLQPIWGLRHPW
jgi:phosphoribosyl 1,2-cyclic phosphodiesterase